MEAPIEPQVLGSIGKEEGDGGTAPVKRKRGRPPKNGGASTSGGEVVKVVARKRKREEEEDEVVCFICFDGGNLVVCDKRGCPKVYHPACIHREESFFKTRGKWNCGWHICSMCQKNSQFMCYTCTYSSCKNCLKNSKFFRVRGNKGFCDTCFGTIVLIEDDSTITNPDQKVKVDFDDKNSWEYLFKLYWVELRENISLTIQELKTAKEKWDPLAVQSSKLEFSDDSYELNSDMEASSDGSSGHQKKGRKKRGRKSTKNQNQSSNRGPKSAQQKIRVKKEQISEIKVMPLPDGAEWATPDLLEFVSHMRDGNKSYISRFDVQALVLDYIKKNSLRDPRKKSQIVCDERLFKLFGKPRVGHLEMLSLIENHCLIKETSDPQNSNNDDNSNKVSNEGVNGNTPNLGQVENAEVVPEKKRRKRRTKAEMNGIQVDIVNTSIKGNDYAAIDMHNLGMIYLKRGLAEELVDDSEKFKEKILGAFVRIRIPGVGQKQDMYRLVKVVGTSKAGDKYKVGKKMTEIMLEIMNLDKKEIITVDAMSNQNFSEEECKRLRQSIKQGLITPLKVGEVQEKAKSLQSLRINEILENEKQRLTHLRDRASETGRRKELRECVEKLQILNTPEERERRMNEVPAVHSDPQMDPAFKSSDEPAKDKPKPDRPRAKNNTKDPTTSTIPRTRKPREPKNPTPQTQTQTPKPATEILNPNPKPSKPASQFGIPPETATSSPEQMGGEKVWHYRDPTGNIQGPFSIAQLAKWSTYFPKDLRVWLMIESEDSSLPLTDILPKNLKVSSENAPGSSGTQNVSNNVKPVGQVNSTSAVVPDSSKVAVQANNSNSIKEYGNIWSPTKSNLGSISTNSNQQAKTTQPKESKGKQQQETHQSANLPNNSVLALPHDLNKNTVPTNPPSLNSNSKTGTNNTTTPSLPPPVPPQSNPISSQPSDTLNPKPSEQTLKPKPQQPLKPKETPVKPEPQTLTPTPTPSPSITTTSSITPNMNTNLTQTLDNKPSPEKDKTQTETHHSEPSEPDESWPEVQVHESTGVEDWVPDPTTTSLETGTSYPSDCLSPADILLSLSRVADEDLEDGDFQVRMEALKKKSRFGEREIDLSVEPGVDCGGPGLGEKVQDPLGADWALPSPTPLGGGKGPALGIDTVSTSGHNVAESLFISGGVAQRAVQPNPEPMLARTTYVDLNTSLQGSMGGSTSDTWTNHLAHENNNTGVTWSNNTSNDVSMTSGNNAAGAMSWMDMNNPNVNDARGVQGNNTGVTWSTLSGSVSPAQQQQKPKPYNSWAETMHSNVSNVGWAGVPANSSQYNRPGWGQPAINHHVNPNPPNTNPNPIQEQRKEVVTDANASWGTTLALGNNNTHNNNNINNNNNSHWDSSGGMDWASQWNNPTWHGNGSQSRSHLIPNNNNSNSNNNVRGQAYQRMICKFHESGYCRKGASCNYLHP